MTYPAIYEPAVKRMQPHIARQFGEAFDRMRRHEAEQHGLTAEPGWDAARADKALMLNGCISARVATIHECLRTVGITANVLPLSD